MKKPIALLLIFCAAFTACGPRDSGSLPAPEIVCANAGLLVKIAHSDPENPCQVSGVLLTLSLPVTGEEIQYDGSLNEQGDYFFDVPVENTPFAGILNVTNPKDSYQAFLFLDADKTNELHLVQDSVGAITKADIKPSYGFTSYDRINFSKSFMDFVMYQQVTLPEHEMTMAEYQSQKSEKLKERSDYALSRYELSDNARNCLQDMFNILFIPGSDLGITDFDIRYYECLRDLALNDSRYLLNFFFRDIVRVILNQPLFEIPPIGDTPVEEWLTGVKATLTDLVGFGEGQFYDLLASNAYARPMETETRPLSEKQIANIREYFSGRKSAFAEILLRKNAEIQKLAAGVGELTIRDASGVPNEKLIETILAPHKGKTVVVDLWATWCGPCVAAMKDMRKMKADADHDGIAFVYLTGSSDKKLWDDMIKGIGGDHYFLNAEQWEYMMDSYGFEGIPSYVVFDADGNVSAKQEGYPGIETLWGMITGPETR